MGEKRPDGLIVVSTGRRTWTAIIEAKIDKNAIQEDQLKTYLALAKINGIDAVITVSNQMIAHPSHHPVKLGTRDRKGIELFHWSWMMIKTMALLGLDQEVFDNVEQRWILREVTPGGRPGGAGLDALAGRRGLEIITFGDWQKIEAAEEKAATGEAPRVKFHRTRDMLTAARR
ncbi:MAG: hypothetical protein IIC07_06060 [Proteobacteria bacterium]|nr:hypothetical protein [Pseudomonadota bacterium]